MAKRAKIEHAGRVLPAAADTAAQPTNGLSRDDFLFFIGAASAAKQKVADARKAEKRVWQQIKLRGGSITAFKAAMQERDRQDNTTISNLKDFQRYCQYLDLPVGAQMQLFDDPQEGSGYSEEAKFKRARQSGYDRGIQGLNPDEQAYPPMTPEGNEHQTGYNEGKAELCSRFIKINEEIAAEEAAAAAKRAAKSALIEEDSDDQDDDGELPTDDKEWDSAAPEKVEA